MDDGSITVLIPLVILVTLSAFFSASETAFSALNPIRLKSRADGGDIRATRVLHIVEQYDNLLSTILIGNNIVNIAASSLATVFFTNWLGGVYGPTVSTVVLTVVILIFGEITPKSLAKEMPETFAFAFAPVLQVLVFVFRPINFLFSSWKKLLQRFFHSNESDAITEGELVTMVSEAEKDGALTDQESELIRSAIEFDDVEVQDVLTPRVDVVAVPDDISVLELGEIFAENGYSRLPVYHNTIDNVIGVVHEKDYFTALRSGLVNLDKLVSPVIYTTKSTQISHLLRTLRENKQHLAIVVDEYGGTSGIITLEDILEELVGEIWDEHDDAVEQIRLQSDGTYLISGDASIEDVEEDLSIGEPEENDSVTVSGLVQEKLGRLPKVGDNFCWGRYNGTVTKAAHRRVLEVRLTMPPANLAVENS